VDLGDLNRPIAAATRFSPARASWRAVPAADPDHHWAQSTTVDKSFVLGFKSRYLRAEIPNRYVADYVNKFPQKLIGFAGYRPNEPGRWMNCARPRMTCTFAVLPSPPPTRIFIPATAGRCACMPRPSAWHADFDSPGRSIHRAKQAGIRRPLFAGLKLPDRSRVFR